MYTYLIAVLFFFKVLKVCDELYLNGKVTENQLLFLRHHVLTRDEEVAAIYDRFQINQDLKVIMYFVIYI